MPILLTCTILYRIESSNLGSFDLDITVGTSMWAHQFKSVYVYIKRYYVNTVFTNIWQYAMTCHEVMKGNLDAS